MKRLTLALSLGLICVLAQPAHTEPEYTPILRAEGQQLASAIGHYARARAMILAAVQEFDQGLKQANPQVLVDVKEFRNSLLDRAEDLEKILAPQPRASEQGVHFSPDSRLLSDKFRK